MDNNVLMHLLLIKNIGPAVIEKLVKAVSDDEQGVFTKNIYEWQQSDFMRAGISAKVAILLVEGLACTALLDRELELCYEHDVKVVTLWDAEYPALLKNTHLPPPILYYKGNFSALCHEYAVALVGSRKANLYGKRAVDLLVPDLVNVGVATVSGGASGIDTLVHEATLKTGGATVAVLGSGLLRPYPSENTRLFERIAQEKGAVVSSFPLLMDALPGNFPARNRIIAGLSQLCVVVQAAQKSGALITAQYALNEGRSVGAVPGPIDDELSYGGYTLLDAGARLISSSHDIFEELSGISAGVSSKVQSEGLVVQEKQKTIYDHQLKLERAMSVSKPIIDEDPVVQACRKAKGFEQLRVEIGLPDNELKDRLFMLQLEGKIEQDFAGLWRTV